MRGLGQDMNFIGRLRQLLVHRRAIDAIDERPQQSVASQNRNGEDGGLGRKVDAA
jgi:hypothetical protein